MIDIRVGTPNPPFLIIDPSDTPIINNITHAKANEYLRCHSILWRLIIDCRYSKSSEFDFRRDFVDFTLFIVRL